MAQLREMPAIAVGVDELRKWGKAWLKAGKAKAKFFAKKEGMDFPQVFDKRVAASLAKMLGDIPVVTPGRNDLIPPKRDCVEIGACRVIGGIRPQNYDVCYRPDGVRFAFDSKSLNDVKSLAKNYQNMINDLGTEATTVHLRFPYAIVAFMVIVPEPIFTGSQKLALTATLERMTLRRSPLDSAHKAEGISLVVWNPHDGLINADLPPKRSPLRLETFSSQVEQSYVDRYKGLPPHTE